MIQDLDELIERLQAVRREYPNMETSGVVVTTPHGDLSLKGVSSCVDDGEDARQHGRACGRPQVFVYLDAEEE